MRWIEHKVRQLSPNYRRAVKNIYWMVLGKVVNVISGLLIGVAVARYLGPEKFGLMNYVISYVALFSILATLGTESILVRDLARAPHRRSVLLGTAFALRIILAAGTMMAILATLLVFEADRHVFFMIMVYSITLIFNAFGVIQSYFSAIVLNEYIVKTEIIRTILGAGIKLALLLEHCSLSWFIAASVFDSILVGSGYMYSYLKKAGALSEWRVDWHVGIQLLRESFPMLLSGAAVIIYQKIDAVMIRNMLDAAAAGQFAAALRIVDLGLFLPVVISQTVTPLLVRLHQSSDVVKYREKRQEFMDFMVWSACVLAALISISAAPVIRILYGESYAAAIPVLHIMGWKAVFVALFSASGQIIIVEGLQRYAVFRNILGCAVSVTLNLLLIPVWGVPGSALAAIIAVAVSGYGAHWLIRPYQQLVSIQNAAIVKGWRRCLTVGYSVLTASHREKR